MTSQHTLAFVFPAFIHEYPPDPFGGCAELAEVFSALLKKAGNQEPGLSSIDFTPNPFHEDELHTQFITFIFSCAASELLKSRRNPPSYSAGYSMGLYATLVHSNAVTFEEGLFLIRKAYEIIRQEISDQNHGMCAVIGLSREDIENLVESGKLNLRIVNRNSPFAFVLSGYAENISRFRDMALAEGALNVNPLEVSVPYHSEFLKHTKVAFSSFIDLIPLRKPKNRIISLIDQRILTGVKDISKELVSNLFTPLNWYNTQRRLLELGVTTFVEMGPGKSLVKNAKFIEGNYRFHSLQDYIKQP